MIRNELGRAARSANRPRGSVGASSARARGVRQGSGRRFSCGYGGQAGQAQTPALEPASLADRSEGRARRPGARAPGRLRPARRAVRPAPLPTRPLLRKLRIQAPDDTLEHSRNLAATRPVATLAGIRRRNRNEARAAARARPHFELVTEAYVAEIAMRPGPQPWKFRSCTFVPAALLASMRLASEARQSSEALWPACCP